MAKVVRVLGPVEAASIGALSGVIEVLLQQPSVTIKNAIQDKQPISWDPRVLYRGVLVNATSMAPISAIQFGVNSLLERSLKGPPNPAQRAGFAAVAGMVSAMVSGPAELLMIQQQKTGSSLIAQLKRVANEHGILALSRGLGAASMVTRLQQAKMSFASFYNSLLAGWKWKTRDVATL